MKKEAEKERTQRTRSTFGKKQEEEAAETRRSAASSRNNFPYMRYFVSTGGFSAYRAAPLRRGMKPRQLPCQLPRLMAAAILISQAIRGCLRVFLVDRGERTCSTDLLFQSEQ